MGRRDRKKLSFREVARALFGTAQLPATAPARADLRPSRLPRGWYTFEIRTIDGGGRTALDLYARYVDAKGTDDLEAAARSAAAKLERSKTERPTGWYTFEVRAIDAAGRTASNVYSWLVEHAMHSDPATEVA